MDGAFGIGDLAAATGTKVVTIRYYERIGLLPRPARTQGNYRMYGTEAVRRLRFVRRCRALGFSIEEVRGLLELSLQKERTCADIDRITTAHLGEIQRKIEDLTRLAGELQRLSECCKGDRTIADCRILEALSPDPA